ncbi:visual pigment-like receptor peropsin [Protobothrops mucrosquamatus]|uniref:visual pigment-like receptor peropsin n=1 Tax=Protobothrops mucrosquamatus TaxID=103944 RepID=UPI0007759EF4|nr:visual pigment-like receptor peropsin [Protobothrops mucrosquamatus]
MTVESNSELPSAFSQKEHNIIAAYLIAAGIISLLSNVVVLSIFIKFKELRTPSNTIIIHLAFTDIGVSSIGYPMSAASDLHGSWKFGYLGCQIYAALNIFFGMASIGLLTVVAIDRYLTICKPQIGNRLTTHNYIALIFAAWTNAVFWASMPVVGWANYAPDPTGATCTINWRENDTYVLFIMSVVMILMFLLAWSPYSIVCLWSAFGDPKKIPPTMAIIAPLFAKSSTFYNPCIYVIANKK